MKEKIKWILTEILYNELNLKEIEDKLKEMNIPSKEIINPDNYPLVSNYFFLLNDIHVDNLTEEEQKQLSFYYIQSGKNDETSRKNLYDFVNKNKLKLILPKEKEGYTSYGPSSPDYTISNEYIVFSLDFIEFDENNPVSDENYDIICDFMKDIEQRHGPNNDLKIKVIECTEMLPNAIRLM